MQGYIYIWLKIAGNFFFVKKYRSSLSTRYYWPWEDVDLSHEEGPRMERNNLIEFFTAAQNEFIHGPPRK